MRTRASPGPMDDGGDSNPRSFGDSTDFEDEEDRHGTGRSIGAAERNTRQDDGLAVAARGKIGLLARLSIGGSGDRQSLAQLGLVVGTDGCGQDWPWVVPAVGARVHTQPPAGEAMSGGMATRVRGSVMLTRPQRDTATPEYATAVVRGNAHRTRSPKDKAISGGRGRHPEDVALVGRGRRGRTTARDYSAAAEATTQETQQLIT